MDQDTLKLSQVLSDPTRFSIYQFISKQREDVTVQMIANKFNVHPNVARLHLTKLVEVKMIVTETRKTGKGGRPSRFYRLSNEVVQLQFPFRDYQRLAKMALESLVEFGTEGLEALQKIGYKYGKESAAAYVEQFQVDLSKLTLKEKLAMIEQIATNQGLNPDLRFIEETGEIQFSIYNCTFNELLKEHSFSLCSMHHQLFSGIFSYFFGKHTLKRNINNGESDRQVCSYSVVCE